ncbi:tRNA (adenine(22)-N(1))-methyltransferase TrmK [Shewanella olleyana]|uniref:tRNA (adenine(22)-N(1))-methyltransferase n=1 Tax=Shewanella olleyana TaxID=135626 RepID=UPI00200D0F0F|nr:tRNA (adenine(22)-N(1))-methyltransferase TrmK [Shewanella olleyana]MCL1067965.1 tRNA (adenine(22)-N(1))-methyltransferase TrmK [Shewanella olleyana]
MKLSKRLQQINSMVLSGYDHIWDCCCDHGFLGGALLTRQAAPNIHFVDIVAELMNELEQKLIKLDSSSKLNPAVPSNWFTHCMDVAKLPLDKYCGKHLIIMAGVGGDLMNEFINSIQKQYANLNIDFLLCPVHHQYSLRQNLISLDFSLKQECLVEDNKRFYEILLVANYTSSACIPDSLNPKTHKTSHAISEVGEQIWFNNIENEQSVSQRYLNKTLSHYQRIQIGRKQEVQHIIDAYKAIDMPHTQ